MIEIVCVMAGGAVALLWAWAFRDARDAYFKAQIAAAKADAARATQALDRAVARGQIARSPNGKPVQRSKV